MDIESTHSPAYVSGSLGKAAATAHAFWRLMLHALYTVTCKCRLFLVCLMTVRRRTLKL